MTPDELMELISRIEELIIELHAPDALTIRPAELSGKPSILKKRFVDESARDHGSKEALLSSHSRLPLSLEVLSLRDDLPALLQDVATTAAQELGAPAWWRAGADFLRARTKDIAALPTARTLASRLRSGVARAERALGIGDVGLACECGRGRLNRDDAGSLICSACLTVWTRAELDEEMRQCVTVKEAAALFSVSESTIRQRISRKKAKPITDNKPYKYRVADCAVSDNDNLTQSELCA